MKISTKKQSIIKRVMNLLEGWGLALSFEQEQILKDMLKQIAECECKKVE